MTSAAPSPSEGGTAVYRAPPLQNSQQPVKKQSPERAGITHIEEMRKADSRGFASRLPRARIDAPAARSPSYSPGRRRRDPPVGVSYALFHYKKEGANEPDPFCRSSTKVYRRRLIAASFSSVLLAPTLALPLPVGVRTLFFVRSFFRRPSPHRALFPRGRWERA